MSVDAFRDYYEQNHRRIGEKYLRGQAVRYVRRYIEPLTGMGEPAHDVVMEIWFPDEDSYAACMRTLGEPEAAQEIAVDEERLFDRPATVSFSVVEVESPMGSNDAALPL
ncbi:MAG: EthD domain-containing protein [Sphingobium sp.]|nr:EthD domain-containing protein [Sphingobium sp.]MCP5398136.1 EthD domain-containing protein [Sphingomonas sp.]